MAFEVCDSEYIDDKSGVFVCLMILGYENFVFIVECWMLINGESIVKVWIIDFWGVVFVIIGKVELVYEGE